MSPSECFQCCCWWCFRLSDDADDGVVVDEQQFGHMILVVFKRRRICRRRRRRRWILQLTHQPTEKTCALVRWLWLVLHYNNDNQDAACGWSWWWWSSWVEKALWLLKAQRTWPHQINHTNNNNNDNENTSNMPLDSCLLNTDDEQDESRRQQPHTVYIYSMCLPCRFSSVESSAITQGAHITYAHTHTHSNHTRADCALASTHDIVCVCALFKCRNVAHKMTKTIYNLKHNWITIATTL